jgi:zinc-ribbon domain
MYCPRCGAQNQADNRFCVSCGSELSSASPKTPVPRRERLRRLLGTTPKARMLSAATALALLVAIAAFVALKPSEGDATPEDAFTRAADRLCVEEKGRVATLERQVLQRGAGNVTAFASALVTVLTEWRFGVQDLPATTVDLEAAGPLDSALLDVLIRAGALARVARAGSQAEIAREAQRVDEASIEVDRQIEQLGLDRCSEVEA